MATREERKAQNSAWLRDNFDHIMKALVLDLLKEKPQDPVSENLNLSGIGLLAGFRIISPPGNRQTPGM